MHSMNSQTDTEAFMTAIICINAIRNSQPLWKSVEELFFTFEANYVQIYLDKSRILFVWQVRFWSAPYDSPQLH